VAPLRKSDDRVYPRTKGVPQGSAIGLVRANLYLHYAMTNGCAGIILNVRSNATQVIVCQECFNQADGKQCSIRDGGGPAGTGLQELVSNYRKLHWLKVFVVSVTAKRST